MPTDCSTLACLNNGRCMLANNWPYCNCSGTTYIGRTCEKSPLQGMKDNAERAGMQAAADKAGKAQEQLQKDKAKCSDPAKRMLCPKSTSKEGMCVGAIADCFDDADAMGAYKSTKDSKCDRAAGEKFCDQEGICLGKGASCAPADKCPVKKPFRCPSWGCAADEAGCESQAVAKPPACAAGEQRCPDGLCYLGKGGLRECAKMGVQWEGCPPGMMECPGGKPGTCARNATKCTAKVGCASSLAFCGHQRDPKTGKPIMDETTGRPKAICKPKVECTVDQDRPPMPTTRPLDPSAGGTIEAQSTGGKPAVKLKMGKGGFKVGGVEKPVNFSISSVPDSLVQQGAFGAYFESGALLGSLISIEPSADIEVTLMTLDIPILDATANEDAAKCALVLTQTEMLAIKDVTNVTETPTSLGTCGKGEIGTCSCAVQVPHFSTYGVVDTAVAYEARTVIAVNITNTSTSETNGLSSAPRLLCLSRVTTATTLLAALVVLVVL